MSVCCSLHVPGGSGQPLSCECSLQPLSCPALPCSSRTKNMMWYGVLGTKELLQRTYKNLEQRVQLEVQGQGQQALRQGAALWQPLSLISLLQCDGVPISLPSLQGIAVLNIPSYAGGINFWGGTKEDNVSASVIMQGVGYKVLAACPRNMGTLGQGPRVFLLWAHTREKAHFGHLTCPGPVQNFGAPSFDDKKLEVVAVFGSIQMAVSRVINLQHHRIAQVWGRDLLGP